MIISRTPLRMSFVGGGSDMRAFYAHHDGAVLSSAVNKYVFITVNRKFDNGVRVAYSRTEEVASAAEVEIRHGTPAKGEPSPALMQDVLLPLASRKARALLSYLAFQGSAPVSRERLRSTR